MEFNSFDHTIRDVSNLYDRNPEKGLDESAWRKEFGHKLRRVIEEKGINQEQLSGMIGISRQMLSRYVRGTSTPSGYVLTRLSEILGCDVRELTKFGYVDE
jgi:ribosome-binding protein aMBF1 (putative translation factor)